MCILKSFLLRFFPFLRAAFRPISEGDLELAEHSGEGGVDGLDLDKFLLG